MEKFVNTPSELRKKYTEIWQGDTAGADPRKLDKAALAELGHELKPLLRVIRERCLDCCSFQPSEVRRCVSFGCPSWPYRMGTNPLREKKSITDEQREAMAARLAEGRKKIHSDGERRKPEGGETMGL